MAVLKVNSPPCRPLMVYDGDCNFCQHWISKLTVEGVDYAPSQSPEVQARFPEIPREEFNRSVQFIDTDGTVYSGAEGVFRSFALNPKRRWFLWAYKKVPGIRFATEWGYKRIGKNRALLSKLMGLNKQ